MLHLRIWAYGPDTLSEVGWPKAPPQRVSGNLHQGATSGLFSNPVKLIESHWPTAGSLLDFDNGRVTFHGGTPDTETKQKLMTLDAVSSSAAICHTSCHAGSEDQALRIPGE